MVRAKLEQCGQAIAEFLILLLVLVPLLLGVQYLAKYSDIQAKTHEAARYAAWERTAWESGGKSDAQIQSDIQIHVLGRLVDDSALTSDKLGHWSGPEGEALVTGLTLSLGEIEPETGPVGLDVGAALGAIAGSANSENDSSALLGQIASKVISGVLQIGGCSTADGPSWPFGPCSMIVVGTIAVTEIFTRVMGAVFSGVGDDFNPLAGGLPGADFISGIGSLVSGVGGVLAVAGGGGAIGCNPSAAVSDVSAGLDSLLAGFTPQSMKDKMGLNSAGLVTTQVSLSARAVLGGQTGPRDDLSFDTTAAVLTDSWAPADADEYQERIANLTAAERMLVNWTSAPAGVLGSLSIMGIGPFSEGCDALQAYSPAPPDALPWDSGDLIGALIDSGTGIAGNVADNYSQTGTAGDASSIIGLGGLTDAAGPPMTIQHPMPGGL